MVGLTLLEITLLLLEDHKPSHLEQMLVIPLEKSLLIVAHIFQPLLPPTPTLTSNLTIAFMSISKPHLAQPPNYQLSQIVDTTIHTAPAKVVLLDIPYQTGIFFIFSNSKKKKKN